MEWTFLHFVKQLNKQGLDKIVIYLKVQKAHLHYPKHIKTKFLTFRINIKNLYFQNSASNMGFSRN